MKVKFLLFTTILIFSNTVFAQTDILPSKFIFNPMYFNPATTGLTDGTELTYSIASNLDFDQSRIPNKEILSIGLPIRGQRWSFGLNAKHEGMIATRDLMLKPTAACRFNFNGGASSIRIGVSGSYTRRRFENAFVFPNLSDQHINSTNLGAGVFYSRKSTYLSVSVRDVFRKRMNVVFDTIGVIIPIFIEDRKTDFRGGTSFHPNQIITVRPSIALTRVFPATYFTINDVRYNVEMNLEIDLLDRFNVGASFRDADVLNENSFEPTYLDVWFGYKRREMKFVLVTNYMLDNLAFVTSNRFSAELVFGYRFLTSPAIPHPKGHFF